MTASRYVIIDFDYAVYVTNNAELADYCANIFEYLVIDTEKGTLIEDDTKLPEADPEWMVQE
jgi:hypothetical protein